MDYIDGEGVFKWSSGEIYNGVFKVDTLVEFGKTLDVKTEILKMDGNTALEVQKR